MPKKIFVVVTSGEIAGVLDDSVYKNEGDVINSIPDEVYEHEDIEVETHEIKSFTEQIFKV